MMKEEDPTKYEAHFSKFIEAGIDAAVRWLRAPSIESTSVANRRRQRGAPLIQLIGTADGPRFAPTRAGTATHLSGLKPSEGVVLLDSLSEVARRFYTGSTLQLTILLTPFREHALKTSAERWGLVLRRLGGLATDERRLLELQGIVPSRPSGQSVTGPVVGKGGNPAAGQGTLEGSAIRQWCGLRAGHGLRGRD